MSTLIWGFPNTAAVTANELGNTWQYKEVQTTAAQLLNSLTSPIQLLPALTGNQYYVYNIHVLFTIGTSNYVGDYWWLGDNAVLSNGTLHGWPAGTVMFGQASNIGGIDTNTIPNYVTTTTLRCGVGQEILFYGDNAGGNPTGGNGTFKFKIWYQVYEA